MSHNAEIFSEKVSRASWKEISTTYVHCATDMATPLKLQKSMVRCATENRTANLVTVTYDSGHFPFLSVLTQVIEIAEKAWVKGRRAWSLLIYAREFGLRLN
jgi:hypothetical protein